MKLSLFTPTHDPKYLAELYQTIKKQKHKDWEWVICPNSKKGTPLPALPAEITADSRVVVVPLLHEGKPNIGQLKRFCCTKATGDVLIEMDHDDLLVPAALTKINQAAEAGGEFIYSDVGCFRDDTERTSGGYDPRWGWENYEFAYYGRPTIATRNFEITPASLCQVFYAPDHVRCWRRDKYFEIGGHNPSLLICDDHDLICRSYIAGLNFQHVGGCVYLYRRHDNNTVKLYSEEIKGQTATNCRLHLHKLIDAWLKHTGYVYHDLETRPILWVGGKPRIDADDNTVGCVKAYGNTLPLIPHEHITSLFNEVYRVLVPGGYFSVDFPTTDSAAGFAPHFKSFWNNRTLSHYTNKELAAGMPDHNCRFQSIQAFLHHKDADKNHVCCRADLSALKGQRQPGRVFI